MIPASKDIFNRAELLLGADVMERLASARVILFGVGGSAAGARKDSSGPASGT